MKREKSVQKNAAVSDSSPDVAEKALRQRNKWRHQFDRRTLKSSP